MTTYPDPGAERCDSATARTLAAMLQSRGLLEPLRQRSAALPAAADAEAALREMLDLLPAALLHELVREAATAYLASPTYRLAGQMYRSGCFNGLTLFDDAHSYVVLTSVSANELALNERRIAAERAGKPRAVAVVAGDTLMRFVRARDVQVTMWRSPLADYVTPIGPSTVLEEGASLAVNSGDEVFLRGGEQNLTIESSPAPILILTVTMSARRSPVVVEYDRATRAATSLSASDERASRIQMLATLARIAEPGRVDALFAPLLGHRDYFVRWHLLREMAAADAAAALPHLRAAADADPHPHVRQAAAATLRLIEERAACP